MAWKYVEFPLIKPAMQQIKEELDDHLRRADRDSTAQRALRELRLWARFLDLIERYELLERDPRTFLNTPGSLRGQPFFRVRVKPFSLLYVRDPVARTVTAVAVFHDKDENRFYDDIFRSVRAAQ